MKIAHYIRSTRNVKKKGYRWVSPEETVCLHDYLIKGGLFYLGNSMPDNSYLGEDNPCLINPELKLGVSWKDDFTPCSGYSKSLPGFRRTYLKWLANGRPPLGMLSKCPICFLYGLEHRLLVDGANGLVSASERNLIIREIIRLMELNPNNLSFIDNAAYLLVYEWLAFGKKESLPEYVRFCTDNFHSDKDAKALVLYEIFRHIISGEPFSPVKLLKLTFYHPKHEWRVRHSDPSYARLFQRLSQIRCREKFGSGLTLMPGNSVTKLSYEVSDSSLSGLRLPVCGLPDNLFDGDGLFEEIEKLIKLCEQELHNYRVKSRKSDEKSTVWLLSLLPAELLYIDERLASFNKLLFGPNFQIPRLFRFNELYQCLQSMDCLTSESKKKIRSQDFQKMILLLEAMRFGVAPLREVHAVAHNYDEFFVFPAPEKIRADDESFCKALLIILLDSLYNSPDTNFTARHQAFLDTCHSLNKTERSSLYAFSLWRQKYANIPCQSRLYCWCNDLSSVERKQIALIIVKLAGAKRSSPKEIKRLAHVYRKLMLTEQQLIADLNMFGMQNTLTDLWPENSREEFNLDESLLQKYEAETRIVHGLLQAVFAGEDEFVQDFNLQNNQVLPVEHNQVLPVENNGLDAVHQQLFWHLTKQEVWCKSDWNKLCHSLDLMPDGAIENINQWFMARTDCILIDGEDSLYVDIELAREFMSLTGQPMTEKYDENCVGVGI